MHVSASGAAGIADLGGSSKYFWNLAQGALCVMLAEAVKLRKGFHVNGS